MITARNVADLGLSRAYVAEALPGLPGSGTPALEFHPEGRPPRSEGLVVKVSPPSGEPWIGNFQVGDGTLSGVFAAPSDRTVCVVAGGRGYLVPVLDPGRYEIVAAYPVRDVQGLGDLGLIVFASFTDVVAYNSLGRAWSAGRVSWDGVTLTKVSTEGIHGTAWDSPGEREVGFFIDPRTGRLEGGAAPPESPSTPP